MRAGGPEWRDMVAFMGAWVLACAILAAAWLVGQLMAWLE